MKNTRTLISSSIVSIIIMVLGMFMLCMSRAPRISFDEPLVEGGGVENDSAGVDEDDFLSLLGEENNQTTATENNGESASKEDDFLSLLNEDEANTNTYTPDQSTESGDEGLDEILGLLEADDTAGSENPGNISDSADTENLSNNDDSDWLEALTATESKETTSTQPGGTGSAEQLSTDQLAKEVEQLEGVLAEKTTTAKNLQTEISQYDQRIVADQTKSSSAEGKRTPIQTASYYESTPAEKSSYQANKAVSRTYEGSSYDNAYNTALDLFQNHQYPEAINAFYELLQQNPNHPLADNSQYWIGECRYAQGKYYQAVAEFNKVFAYDTPDKQDDAQLMLGLTYLKLGELGAARIEFDWLVSCYASSEYVSTAHRYLGQY